MDKFWFNAHQGRGGGGGGGQFGGAYKFGGRGVIHGTLLHLEPTRQIQMSYGWETEPGGTAAPTDTASSEVPCAISAEPRVSDTETDTPSDFIPHHALLNNT